MRPVIEALRRRGDEVLVTARDFAQTLGLLERFRLDHTAIGHHRGGKLAAKGVGLASRSAARSRAGRAGAGSTSRSATAPTTSRVAAKLLRIPSVTAFDYEWARQQHHDQLPARDAESWCRTRSRPSACTPYGATRRQAAPLRGPQGGVLPGGLRARPGGARPSSASTATGRSRSCARRPRSRSTTASRRRSSPQVLAPPARASRSSSSRAPTSSARSSQGGRLHRPRAGDRRAVADRLRRPRDLRRRDDEPRGGGARHAGLDDVRGPPRRGRRAR